MFSLQDNLTAIFFKLTLNQSSYHFIWTSTQETAFHTCRCQNLQCGDPNDRNILQSEEVKDALRYISKEFRRHLWICKFRKPNRIANRQIGLRVHCLCLYKTPKNTLDMVLKMKISASEENRNSACPVRVLWPYRLWYVGCNYRMSIRDLLKVLLEYCVWE